MPTKWQEYQLSAAKFFRKLGLEATVEHEVEGARGKHKIDVFVRGSYLGIDFKWIVECKAWKTNIPKEKVLALAGIIQDVGADRGFLLSEVGFQSGAIQSATKTNVTLTSLLDLSAATGPKVVDAVIGHLHWRLTKAQNRLREIKRKKYDDDYFPPTLEPLSSLMLLDLSFADAAKGTYPIIYYVNDGVRHQAKTLEELVAGADQLITAADRWTPPAEKR